MSRVSSKEVTEWLKANDPTYGHRRPFTGDHKVKRGVDCRRTKAITNHKEKVAKLRARHKVAPQSIKDFVEEHRHQKGHDCVFVPMAIKNRPAVVNFCDKNISAARYMCLLTHGTPKYEGAVARHTCGNGHLSCINPNHIKWGDVSDNASDAQNHRHAGDNTQDRVNSVTR